jgi:hypothetical protein
MKQIFLSFLTVCSLMMMMITTAAKAQEAQRTDLLKHELSVYGTGGYSPLSLALTVDGTTSSGIGGGAGASYTYNFNPSLGIVVGVEMSTYNSEVSVGRISGEYEEGTGNEMFRFSYTLNSYRETQNITVFSIPVMAQYSLPLGGGSTRFYASGGLKLGFPVSAEAEISPGTATTSGYLSHEMVRYENLREHGFGTDIKLPDSKKDIDVNFSASLALETGIRFTLTDKIGLYTGVYFDYGLNSIQKVNDKHPLEYDAKHLSEYDAKNESPFIYHSLLNTSLTDKVKLMSVGLKLRIGFKL